MVKNDICLGGADIYLLKVNNQTPEQDENSFKS